jgi:hypothetical protein
MKMIALGLFMVLVPHLTFAALPKLASKVLTQASTQPIPQFSLDILEQKIQSLKGKSKKKKSSFFKAHQAFLQSDWKGLSTEASHWIAQGHYIDVGYWLKSKAQKELAKKALAQKNYSLSLKLSREGTQSLLKMIEDHANSPYSKLIPRELGELELIEGNSHCGLKKLQSAQTSFENGFQRMHSQDALAAVDPLTLDHYAESCVQRESQFCRYWAEKFVKAFSKKSNEVQLLGRTFKDLAESVKSPGAYPKVTTSYKAPDLDSAAYTDALQFYGDAKYSKAAQSLRQFLDDFPRSNLKTRALYWLARSLERSGSSSDAQSVYETIERTSGLSFHAILSCQKTKRNLAEMASALIPLGAERDFALNSQESNYLKRAQEFLESGAYSFASQELKEIKSKETLSTPFLMYLVLLQSEVGNTLQTFQIISELIQRGAPEVYSSFIMRRVFPVVHRDPIETYANLHGLDPILVMSLIKQESSFDANILSWVGAMGLMQLMPGTAVETDPKVTVSSLFKAEENIRVGTLYLKRLLDRYSGNTVFALAAYNAGPSAVDRWIKNSSEKDMIEFIESIPYKETREYVGSIIRNYFWYSHYLKGVFPDSVEMFWTGYPAPKKELEQKRTPQPQGST